MTGFYPVIWGSDFSFNYKDQREVDSIRQAIVDTAIVLYGKGHIITLMWHACYPPDGDTCDSKTIWRWDNVVNEEEWDELTTEGTELNNLWKKQVDNVAGYLKQLQIAGVPILWRPYHEMNGIWFWWCNHPGENGFIKLWKMMYNYLTEYHEINNLIWVWNPNAPRDKENDEAYAYIDYFPGVEYVDVLAADVYHNDYRQSHHDQLLEIGKGKPIALGEVGRMPAPKIIENQPKWTWFMGWADWLFKANSPDSVIALYNSPRTISMEMISKEESGKYIILKTVHEKITD
jgi:mannan endo-1,4-beta-mannosidase